MINIFNFFKKPRDYSAPVNAPEDRVVAFIEHWHAQWSISLKKMGEDVDFDYWAEQVFVVDKAHFIAGRGSGSENAFGYKAEYDPKTEKITECDIDGKFAQVYTETYDEATKLSTYHVYELVRDAEGDWKITTIFTLFHPPKSSVIDASKHNDIMAMSIENAPFIDREAHTDLNENTLFQPDRTVNIPNWDQAVAKLEQIGELKLSSGVIGILDFGYDIYDFEPLHRKVKPGEYAVETVTIHERVAGIRVKFSDSERPVKWHAANTPSGNGVYGVDAANLAILDVGDLIGLSRLGKEKIFSDWSVLCKPALVSMTGTDDCVITPSGCGDGCYPAYWGVNEQDEVVSLYVDFMILVKENEQGIYEFI